MHPANIAHRGGAALKPENSLAAFKDAMVRGCDGAELDVQLSADGQVVVHHDYRLNPAITRQDGVWLKAAGPRIKDLKLAELRKFDIGRPDPGSAYAKAHGLLSPADGERIPALAEVLALARAWPEPFTLFVELKTNGGPDAADPMALADAVFQVMKDDFSRAIFVGFNWQALLRVKAHAKAAKVWFSTDKMQGDLSAIIDGIAAAGADGWFPHHANAMPQTVAHARARGLAVGSWTVNDPAEMRRLMDMDALCTDRPDLLAGLAGG
jgi:glycerophosphoryl diester phosphodiesterase